jgi:hypothetical protein
VNQEKEGETYNHKDRYKPEEAYTLLPLLLMMILMLSWTVIRIDPSFQHLFLQKRKKCLHRWLFLVTKV